MLNLNSLFFTGDDEESCLHRSLDLLLPEREHIAKAKLEVRMCLKAGIPRILKERGYADIVPQPRFFTQGSWAYKTINAPAKHPQQADVDDGCYLPLSFLTQTRRPSVAASLFFEVAEAALTPLVEMQGWRIIPGKSTCVRIEISKQAHIDIPLYAIPDVEFATLTAKALDHAFESFNEALARAERDAWTALPRDSVLLAHREHNWIESDPRPVKEWFLREVDERGEQLRRVVRYLKAFRDWNWISGGPTSILLMAAAVPAFEKNDRRDDLALLHVVQRLPDSLRKGVNNPVDDSESLTERLRNSDKEKDLVEESVFAFKRFEGQLGGAIAASSAPQACEWMRQAFGSRFPNCPDRVKIVPSALNPVKSNVLDSLLASGSALTRSNPSSPVPVGSRNTLG